MIDLLKDIELELRSGAKSSSMNVLRKMSDLSDWEYRIVQDFILRVNLAIQSNNLNFVYKLYNNTEHKIGKKKIDIVIACLKRNERDTVLTDVTNRLIIPEGLSYQLITIWGMQVTKARNFAVEQALRLGADYLLFIDDDILVPNNTLIKLYSDMKSNGSLCVAAQYYRKVSPFISAHSTSIKDIKSSDHYHADEVCAMGCTLLNLKEITYKVPAPLFWEFGAPDGYWSMGEDAFFTKNLIHYTGSIPLVDKTIGCLHYDKVWKKMYGDIDKTVTYASNIIEDFETMRIPPKYPSILIGIPTRNQEDPIAANLNNLSLLRGYRTELFRTYGLRVDDARNTIVKEALNRGSDYILFIDDDIVPPIDGLDRLLIHMESDKYHIVSGDYLTKGYKPHSVHLQLNDKGLVTELDRFADSDLVESNWLIGLGFTLVKTDIFKQLRFPWFQCHAKSQHTDQDINEDAHFCELSLESGYKIVVDRSIRCAHIDYKSNKIYTNNIKHLASHEWIRNMEVVNAI